MYISNDIEVDTMELFGEIEDDIRNLIQEEAEDMVDNKIGDVVDEAVDDAMKEAKESIKYLRSRMMILEAEMKSLKKAKTK